MEPPLSILSVGSTLELADGSVSWADDYNIKDFDWVFLDFWSLDQQISDSNFEEEFGAHIQRPESGDILKFVRNGNSMVVFLPSTSRIKIAARSNIGFSSIFPMHFALIEESGNTVDPDSINSEWNWYFTETGFDWQTWIDGSFQIKDNIQVEIRTKSLVENPSGERLAVEFEVGPVTGTQGRIILLPVIDGWSPSEAMAEILKRYTSIDPDVEVSSAPDWIDEYSLPGEQDAVESLEGLRRRREEIESEIEETEEDLKEYDRYKVLLHGNQGALEKIVPKVFREMGFEISGEESHHRDGILEVREKEFVMEITGTTGGIRVDKCRQLDQWVGDLMLESEEKDYQGMLVVNPLRHQRPEERNQDEFMPPHIERFLKTRDYKVLLTPDLYSIYEKFVEGEMEKEEIEELLLSEEFIVSANSG